MDKIFSIVRDKNFIRLTDKYLPYFLDEKTRSYKEYFENKINNIVNKDFLVPILGVQGVGKSTIINALLMEDIILPIDADETTCIPVEVRYGKDNSGEIRLYYKDDIKYEVLTDHKELEKYVHNEHNPGNEKNVSHIIVYKNNDLLQNNLVLVDLPGVGSLTYGNVETTMKYVERLSGAIFLLRTVPPITKPEKVFISAVWPKLTSAWFIQNQWNDESLEEVMDGKEYNQYVLEEIAKQYCTEFRNDIKIVNAYKALNAKLQSDDKGYEESGMKEIRDLIKELSSNWKLILNKSFINHIKELVHGMKENILRERNELDTNIDELKTRFIEEEIVLKEKFDKNKKIIREVESKISEYKIFAMDFVDSQSRIQHENLRNEMRRVIGSGIVDGELLNKAFKENQELIAAESMEELMLKLFEMQNDIAILLEELEIRDYTGKFEKVSKFYKDEALKFEKIIPPAASTVGAIGGGFIGVKAGSAIGTAIGGPVGTIIGGIAGFAIGTGIALVATWLGDKGKEAINRQRQKYTLRDIEEPLRVFRNNLKHTIDKEFEKVFKNIEDQLNKFIELQNSMINTEKIKHEEKIKNMKTDINSMIRELDKDLNDALRFEVAINEL